MVNQHATDPATAQDTDAATAMSRVAQGFPSMRGAVERPALVRDEQPDESSPITRDSEAFRKLAEDLRVRRVLWMLVQGFTWPHLLEGVTTPAARNRAVRRGLVASPAGEPGALLLPYLLTDAGRAELLAWVQDITPHRHLPEVAALWAAVTTK